MKKLGSGKHKLPQPNVNQTGFEYKPPKYRKGHADFGPQPAVPGPKMDTGDALRDGGDYSHGKFPRKVNK